MNYRVRLLRQKCQEVLRIMESLNIYSFMTTIKTKSADDEDSVRSLKVPEQACKQALSLTFFSSTSGFWLWQQRKRKMKISYRHITSKFN